MPQTYAPHHVGDTLRDVLENYRCYLSRNRDLSDHRKQFLKREKGDPAAAEAEAVAFSWLRAEKLNPRLFEDAGTGGPDFHCTMPGGNSFLVEVTSLDSGMASKRSGLPAKITGPGGQAYGLITEKLKAKAQEKASQLAGYETPTVLAIVSSYDFASLLLDRMAAEYLMTSAPQINVPLGGGAKYWTADLRNSVFLRASGVVDESGALIIKPALQSIGAILLTTVTRCDVRMVGLLHFAATHPFDPQWLSNIPFVKFAGVPSNSNIATEWIQADGLSGEAIFPHRRIR